MPTERITVAWLGSGRTVSVGCVRSGMAVRSMRRSAFYRSKFGRGRNFGGRVRRGDSRRGLARMQEEFLVAFGSGQAAGPHGDGLEPRGDGRRPDALDRAVVQPRIANDAAAAHFAALKLKLRLDQNEEIGARLGRRG